MANGNAYRYYVESRAEVAEKKEYNVVWILGVVTVIVLVLMI